MDARFSDWPLRPTFLGIGAEKTGSTSLHRYLGQHPQVFVPSMKEPAFFASDDNPLVRDAADYRRLFDGSEGFRARGEVSARYLHSEAAPRAIRDSIPDVRIVGVLRDPVERAYSHFLMLMASHEDVEESDFGSAVHRRLDRPWHGSGDLITEFCLRRSLYADAVRTYLDLFGPDRVRFFRYEDFDAEPERVMGEIFRFIGVDDRFAPDVTERLNVSSGVSKLRSLRHFILRDSPAKRFLRNSVPALVREPVRRFVMRRTRPRKSGIDPSVRTMLVERYTADIEAVEALLDLDLSRWKR